MFLTCAGYCMTGQTGTVSGPRQSAIDPVGKLEQHACAKGQDGHETGVRQPDFKLSSIKQMDDQCHQWAYVELKALVWCYACYATPFSGKSGSEPAPCDTKL